MERLPTGYLGGMKILGMYKLLSLALYKTKLYQKKKKTLRMFSLKMLFHNLCGFRQILKNCSFLGLQVFAMVAPNNSLNISFMMSRTNEDNSFVISFFGKEDKLRLIV